MRRRRRSGDEGAAADIQRLFQESAEPGGASGEVRSTQVGIEGRLGSPFLNEDEAARVGVVLQEFIEGAADLLAGRFNEPEKNLADGGDSLRTGIDVGDNANRHGTTILHQECERAEPERFATIHTRPQGHTVSTERDEEMDDSCYIE